MARPSKTALIRRARTAAGAVVRRTPPQAWAATGRTGTRLVIAEGRRLAGSAKTSREALRLIDGLGPQATSPAAQAVRGEALRQLGEYGEAQEALNAAINEHRTEVPVAVSNARLAQDAGGLAERERAQQVLLTCRPRNARQAADLLKVVDTDHLETAQGVLRAAEQWEYQPAGSSLELLRLRVAQAVESASLTGEEDLLAATKKAVQRSGAAGLIAGLDMLATRGDYPAMIDLVTTAQLPESEAWPSKPVVKTAQKALRKGWADVAAALTSITMAHDGRVKNAASINAQATDDLLHAEQGWPDDVAADTPAYEPRERTVLAVLAQSMPHTSGGYATRSHGILTGLRHHGWEPTAVTKLGFPYDRWAGKRKHHVDPVDVIDGISYHRILEPGITDYPTVPLANYVERFSRQIEMHARRVRPAIIQASSFQNNGLAALRAARRLGVPFVYEMRGLEDLMKVSRIERFEETTRYRYLLTLETHIAKNADLTLVITHALKDEMVRRGVPADKLVVVPNGVHSADFTPRERDQELAAALGVQGKTIIGYAGGLVDYEGLDTLMGAVAHLKDRRDDFRVVIVGDGAFERQVRDEHARLGLGDLVTFTGRVPHSEVSRYLSLFDITPFPRKPLPVCELISPIKPFEAMAMGKAIITSSVDALTEIISHDETGLVFEKGNDAALAEAIERLLDDPDLRTRLGERAREVAMTGRDWHDVVGSMTRAYDRLGG